MVGWEAGGGGCSHMSTHGAGHMQRRRHAAQRQTSTHPPLLMRMMIGFSLYRSIVDTSCTGQRRWRGGGGSGRVTSAP